MEIRACNDYKIPKADDESETTASAQRHKSMSTDDFGTERDDHLSFFLKVDL